MRRQLHEWVRFCENRACAHAPSTFMTSDSMKTTKTATPRAKRKLSRDAKPNIV